MTTFNINIPEGHEIDLEKSDLKQGTIFFKPIEKQYPTSVEDVPGRKFYIDAFGVIYKTEDVRPSINQVSSRSRAKAFLALMQLVELRDAWNIIDGYTEEDFDWDSKQTKFCIINQNNQAGFIEYHTFHAVLHFGKEKTRDLFFKTFKDLIEEARELI